MSSLSVKRSRTREPECCRRKRKGGETYRYFKRNFLFDVERANEIVRDGREPVELDDESVRGSVDSSRICKPHVAHVDPARPGIIAHVQCLADDGELIKGHVLIDGNHRAARCLELESPVLCLPAYGRRKPGDPAAQTRSDVCQSAARNRWRPRLRQRSGLRAARARSICPQRPKLMSCPLRCAAS